MLFMLQLARRDGHQRAGFRQGINRLTVVPAMQSLESSQQTTLTSPSRPNIHIQPGAIRGRMAAINAVAARSHRNILLVVRSSSSSTLSPTIISLLIALMVLIFLCILGGITFFIVRRVRLSRSSTAADQQLLPQHNGQTGRHHASNHRRLTITASPYGRNSSIYVYDEKSPMMRNQSSPPVSPSDVPEIRITFPDEQDESGQRTSGRVVVVRVGEKGGMGLEPLRNEEQLPAYEKETGGERFQSLDLERMGGLKEKNSWS